MQLAQRSHKAALMEIQQEMLKLRATVTITTVWYPMWTLKDARNVAWARVRINDEHDRSACDTA